MLLIKIFIAKKSSAYLYFR